MVILNLAVNSAIIIYKKLSLNTPERYFSCDAIVDTGKLRRIAGHANRSMYPCLSFAFNLGKKAVLQYK